MTARAAQRVAKLGQTWQERTSGEQWEIANFHRGDRQRAVRLKRPGERLRFVSFAELGHGYYPPDDEAGG